VRRLILFRHAKASGRIGADLDRPLEPRGRADAVVAGRWLLAHGLSPDLVLVSPAARTRETWACVAEDFPKARVEIVDDLYNATPEEVEASIGPWAAEADTLMIVAHNPGLQELAVELVTTSGGSAPAIEGVAAGFPTSAVAVFDLTDGQARLTQLFNPRRPLASPDAGAWGDEAGGSD
jgi:phosphohistidine phosphatase